MTVNRHKTLIVDDEHHVCKTLTIILERAGYAFASAEDGTEAIEMLSKSPYDLVLCNLRMPRIDGMEVLRVLKQTQPDTPLIMITAYGSIKDAVSAMRQGAYFYITKMYNAEELLILIEKAIQQKRLIEENKYLKRQLNQEYSFDNIVGVSPPIKAVFDRIRKVADTESTVLITGESGTGKELIAQAIHYNSPRRHHPMITINCSLLPAEFSKANCSGTSRGLLQVQRGSRKDYSRKPLEVGYFWTKLVNYLPLYRSSFCGQFRRGKFDASGITVQLKSISASWLRQTGCLRKLLSVVNSAKISTIA